MKKETKLLGVGIFLLCFIVPLLLLVIFSWDYFYTTLRYETDMWGNIEEDRGEGYVWGSLTLMIVFLIGGVILILVSRGVHLKIKRKPKKKATKEIKYPTSEENRETIDSDETFQT